MLDGTDVDANINKKRAHKIIMSEAFNAKSRFRLKKKKGGSRPNKSKDADGGQGASMDQNKRTETEATEFAIDDSGQPNNGYIINEDGTIIVVDKANVNSLNKYAADVIKTEVTDHFADLDEDADGDFTHLKGKLMDALMRK